MSDSYPSSVRINDRVMVVPLSLRDKVRYEGERHFGFKEFGLPRMLPVSVFCIGGEIPELINQQ